MSKHPSSPLLVTCVVAGSASLTMLPIAYAAWLDRTPAILLVCAPGVLALGTIVGGFVGAIFFGSAPDSASHSAAESVSSHAPRVVTTRTPAPVYRERTLKTALSGIFHLPQ